MCDDMDAEGLVKGIEAGEGYSIIDNMLEAAMQTTGYDELSPFFEYLLYLKTELAKNTEPVDEAVTTLGLY